MREVRIIKGTFKKIRRIIIAMGIAVSMLGVSSSVYASSIMDEIEKTETVDDVSEDTEYSLLRSSHLNFGNVKIQKLSSNEISIYGLTQCHHKCDTVYLSLYLERKVNGSYGTYKYWEFTANNVTSLSKGLNVAVPSGTYYRVRGYHSAKHGIKESASTLTQGILVK